MGGTIIFGNIHIPVQILIYIDEILTDIHTDMIYLTSTYILYSCFLLGGDFLGSNINRLRSIHKYASIREVLHKGLFCCSSHLKFLFEEVLRWSGIDIASWHAVSWTGKFLNPFDLFESNVSLQVRLVCGIQDLMRQLSEVPGWNIASSLLRI